MPQTRAKIWKGLEAGEMGGVFLWFRVEGIRNTLLSAHILRPSQVNSLEDCKDISFMMAWSYYSCYLELLIRSNVCCPCNKSPSGFASNVAMFDNYISGD